MSDMISKMQYQLGLLIYYIIGILIIGIMLIAISVANATPTSPFQFTTAIGRAAITTDVPEELARMRALEDALYLACLLYTSDAADE